MKIRSERNGGCRIWGDRNNLGVKKSGSMSKVQNGDTFENIGLHM